MTLPHRLIVPFVAVAALMLSAAGPACAADEVAEDTQWAIGQVLLNTIKGERLDQGPTDAMMKTFREQGQNALGPSWGYRTEHKSKVDGKVIQIYMSITVLPKDYQQTPAQLANWEKYKVGDDKDSGAGIAFQESTNGDVRRHRVVYLLHKSGYRMFLHVTRAGDETAEQAVEKTIAGWKQFYQFAVDQGLFNDEKLFIEVLESAAKAGLLEDGGVIHLNLAAGKTAKVPINIWAEAASVEEDKPYTIHLKFKQGKNRSGISLRDEGGRALKDSDGDGWLEHEVIGGKKGRLVLHFEKLSAKPAGNELVLDQVALGRMTLRNNEDGSVTISRDFGAQRRDWFPIVQRFQLIGRNWSPKTADDKPIPDIPADQRMSFNDYLKANDTLRRIFENRIMPLAAAKGKIGDNEEVAMGWRVDPFGTENWYLAVHSPKKPQLPVVQRGVPLTPVVDIKIVQTKQIEQVNLDSPDGLDGDLGGDGGGEEVNTTQEEAELRRLIFIKNDNIKLTMKTIAIVSNGESGDVFAKKLPERLRLEPEGAAAKDGNRPTSNVIWNYIRGKTRLDDYFPLEDRYLTPVGKNEAAALTRIPGTYELHLTVELYHSEEGLDASKKIDVAIRYAVAPDTFKFRIIEWETRRFDPTKN